MGNHDERAAYARAPLRRRVRRAPGPGARRRRAARSSAWTRTVPGWHHGELRESQLAWLADVLATPAPHGTLLAMHHPPIPVPMMRIAEIIELRDQQPLADVVAGQRRPGDHRRALPLHVVLARSPACRCRWPRRPATPPSSRPDDRLLSGVDGAPGASPCCTCTPTAWCTRWSRSADAAEISGYGMEMAAPFDALSRRGALRDGLAQGLAALRRRVRPPGRVVESTPGTRVWSYAPRHVAGSAGPDRGAAHRRLRRPPG